MSLSPTDANRWLKWGNIKWHDPVILRLRALPVFNSMIAAGNHSCPELPRYAQDDNIVLFCRIFNQFNP